MRVYVFMYTQYEDALNTHARAVSDEGDARNAMNNAVFPIGRNLNRAENTPLPKRRHRRQSATCISDNACPQACPLSRPKKRPLAPDASPGTSLKRPAGTNWGRAVAWTKAAPPPSERARYVPGAPQKRCQDLGCAVFEWARGGTRGDPAARHRLALGRASLDARTGSALPSDMPSSPRRPLQNPRCGL